MRLASLFRSHSQTLSRLGRPKTLRNRPGVSNPSSGSWTARVPRGRPANVSDLFRSRYPSRQQEAPRRGGDGARTGNTPAGRVRSRCSGSHRSLVGPPRGEESHQAFQIETVADEVVGQGIEKFGVGRWVAGAEIILGFDQAAAEEVFPVAIDDRSGKERVIGPPEPFGEGFAGILRPRCEHVERLRSIRGGEAGIGSARRVRRLSLGQDEDPRRDRIEELGLRPIPAGTTRRTRNNRPPATSSSKG